MHMLISIVCNYVYNLFRCSVPQLQVVINSFFVHSATLVKGLSLFSGKALKAKKKIQYNTLTFLSIS